MASLIPEDPDTLLRRRPTADALTAKGFKTSPKTLATKATRGGGPPYRHYGRTPLYRWGDALEWAQSRLSEIRSSTSEAETQAVGRGATPDRSDPFAATSEAFTGSGRPLRGSLAQRRHKDLTAGVAAAEAHG
jgi:hypothetical protein